jgi:hypothetical protein
MEGQSQMSRQERERRKIFERVKRGELQAKEAPHFANWSIGICGGCTNDIAPRAIAG